MPQWIIRRGKYYSECHDCRREVEGSEEPGGGAYGRERTVVFFRCSCGSTWHKKKSSMRAAVAGGYHNGLGEWIECDDRGHIKPEVLIKLQEENLGYGVVQVALNLYFRNGVTSAELEKNGTDEKYLIALRLFEEGKSEEEVQKVVGHYLREKRFDAHRR